MSDTILRRSPVAPAAGADGDPRPRLRTMWAAVAPAWAEHADYAEARGADLSERMLTATSPQPGERVLELACGSGGLGLAAAERVAPGGTVVLSDVVAEMTSIAAARASARAITNVSTQQLDLEQIDEPDAAFDIVLCREGLMFAPDPARAAREVTRVLRPGGRLAVSVWGPATSNPWLTIVFAAVQAVTGTTVPPPGVPGPFSLGDRDLLVRLFVDAGVADIDSADVAVPMRAPSFDAWWERTCALAGPLAKVLESLPRQARDAIREHAREAVRDYEQPGQLELPGLALLVSGRRI
jgi:enediyne biosynthesis protein CalE5